MTPTATSVCWRVWLLAGLAAAGCGTHVDSLSSVDPGTPITTPETATGHVFAHPDDLSNLYVDRNRLPPALSVQLHACGKLPYPTLGRILHSRGVNLSVPARLPEKDPARHSAGGLYASGAAMMGAANYALRIPESTRATVAGMSRLGDILIAAAPEIIANLPTQSDCQVDGHGVSLFDDRGCSADGIACLLGIPAPGNIVELCNSQVRAAKDVATGQRLAVAAMALAFYVCD